jgi:hypothetical protein
LKAMLCMGGFCCECVIDEPPSVEIDEVLQPDGRTYRPGQMRCVPLRVTDLDVLGHRSQLREWLMKFINGDQERVDLRLWTDWKNEFQLRKSYPTDIRFNSSGVTLTLNYTGVEYLKTNKSGGKYED